MSSGCDLWQLYPKRSITSHSICGSGPLFRGLRSEKRRAKSGMAELVVVARNTVPDAGKNIQPLFRCQENIAK
jgi:hypothetical protein